MSRQFAYRQGRRRRSPQEPVGRARQGPASAHTPVSPGGHHCSGAGPREREAQRSPSCRRAPQLPRCPRTLWGSTRLPGGSDKAFFPSFPSSSPEILPMRRGRLYETEGNADTASEATGLLDALGPALPEDPRWAPRHPARALRPLCPQTLMHRLQGGPGTKP